ncbi:MAG: orotidine 5'-phosphate decarboxylase / HUMPS family protein [Candidatus Hadarchaeales archaeon]
MPRLDTLLSFVDVDKEGLVSEKFRKKIETLREKKGTPIVLALDFSPDYTESFCNKKESLKKLEALLLELEDYVSGIKIGLPLLLSLGLDGIKRLTREHTKRYFFICDTKMADIGHINVLTAGLLFDAGFDGIIAHAAIGAKDGLIPVVKLAKKKDRGVLGLCAMSHAGANDFLNKNFLKLLLIADSAGVDGFVLPASRPDIIRKARKMFDKPIFSPGVGAQGAPFGSAIVAGSDFEIIGRSITESSEPAKKAKEILEAIRNAKR